MFIDLINPKLIKFPLIVVDQRGKPITKKPTKKKKK
jgi:hypothetical protein